MYKSFKEFKRLVDEAHNVFVNVVYNDDDGAYVKTTKRDVLGELRGADEVICDMRDGDLYIG
jgi:hypothetical protein